MFIQPFPLPQLGTIGHRRAAERLGWETAAPAGASRAAPSRREPPGRTRQTRRAPLDDDHGCIQNEGKTVENHGKIKMEHKHVIRFHEYYILVFLSLVTAVVIKLTFFFAQQRNAL